MGNRLAFPVCAGSFWRFSVGISVQEFIWGFRLRNTVWGDWYRSLVWGLWWCLIWALQSGTLFGVLSWDQGRHLRPGVPADLAW